MIEALISLLVLLLFLVIVFFILQKAIEYFQGPPLATQIIGLILLLIFLIGVLKTVGTGAPIWKL